MATIAKIEVRDADPVAAVRDFLGRILADDSVGALLAPRHLPVGGHVMPMLITDPAELDRVDPLAPCFPLNSAKLVSRLTRGMPGERVAAVLRPCEIRAFVELVKLNQGNMDDVLLIGMDCLGAFSNADYPGFAGDDPAGATRRFLDQAVGGGELNLAKACLACEHPAPEGADLVVGVAGVDLDDFLPVHSRTARGEGLLNRLGLPATTEHQARKQALETLTARRIEFRDRMFEETTQAIGGLDKLAEYLAGCVNCYNCRVACPVCYCRECVFLTDIFDHKPHQYLGWARQKGALKMPTDTVFFHLTRLAHMSTACVGCGQCSNACPNHVPVMELFRTLSDHTQRAFDYQAGRSADEPPPLSVFKEEEFPETISHLA